MMGLTPLIDMIFLLLLFFLLGSDFVSFGQSRLAPPRGSGGQEGASQPIIVSLAQNGDLKINSARTDKTGLAQRAGESLAADPAQLFVVMPQAEANVQQVSDTLDVLVSVGAQSITLERDVFDIDLSDF
jgi:biopolymer transport protein ExbD